MSYRATILYGHPVDPDAFDAHYRDVHIPLARRMRGLTAWSITRLEPGPDGTPPEHHLIAVLEAPDRETLEAIFASPEGRAAAADVATFATGGATFAFGEVQTIIGPGQDAA